MGLLFLYNVVKKMEHINYVVIYSLLMLLTALKVNLSLLGKSDSMLKEEATYSREQPGVNGIFIVPNSGVIKSRLSISS